MDLQYYHNLNNKINIDLKKEKIWVNKDKGQKVPKGKQELHGKYGGTYYEKDINENNLPKYNNQPENNNNSSQDYPLNQEYPLNQLRERSTERLHKSIAKRMPVKAKLRHQSEVPGGEKYNDHEWAILGANVAYDIHKSYKLMQSLLSVCKKYSKGKAHWSFNYKTIDGFTEHCTNMLHRDVDQAYIYFGANAGKELQTAMVGMLDQMRVYKLKGMKLEDHNKHHESVVDRGQIRFEKPTEEQRRQRIRDIMPRFAEEINKIKKNGSEPTTTPMATSR